MKMAFKGDLDPTQNYRPGDIVRDRGRGYRVRSHRGEWLPVAAPPDPSCAGPPGRDGVDGERGANGKDGAPGADGEGFRFRGVWKRGVYQRGDVVTRSGSSWTCVVPSTNTRPGVTKAWQLLAAKGDPGEQGERGPAGSAGATYISRKVTRENTSNDIELLFLEDAHAGEAIYIEEGDKCGVTNTLSEWRSLTFVGFAVNDTVAGSRGLVRTAGLITVPRTLSAGWNYFLKGRGSLCTSADNVTTVVHAGVAVRSDTLLIRPEVLRITSDILTTNGSGPKGAPVYLSGSESVELASMPVNWQVVGVLTEDASGTASFAALADVVQADWSAVLETGSTLTPNQKYYLSDVPGRITTESTGRKFIGVAKSAMRLAFGSEGNEGGLVA